MDQAPGCRACRAPSSGCCTRSSGSSWARTTCSNGCSWRSSHAATSSSRACPGLAKTMAIKTLAETIGGDFKRIQFTPDLVPADLIGTRIYDQKTGEFNTSLGPVFTNLLLADEINRAPAKVQSALLEVMQERQVTIGRETPPGAQTRSSCWRPRTPSRPTARTRCRRRRSTGSCSRSSWAIRARPRSSSSSSGRPGRPGGPAGAVHGAAARRPPATGRRGVRRPGAHRVRGAPGERHPGSPRSTASGSSAATSRSAAARGRRSTSSSRPGRSRSCAAATTPCPRTCWTWRSTCCATGWCCRTRRSPTTSRATTCCAPSSVASRSPMCRCDGHSDIRVSA